MLLKPKIRVEGLYQVTTDFCCASFYVNKKGIIINYAPILSWLRDKDFKTIKGYYKRKGYILKKVKTNVTKTKILMP